MSNVPAQPKGPSNCPIQITKLQWMDIVIVKEENIGILQYFIVCMHLNPTSPIDAKLVSHLCNYNLEINTNDSINKHTSLSLESN